MNMTLYYFNPNDYGEQYIVMSSSKEEALNSVKESLLKKGNDTTSVLADSYMEDYNEWKDATVDNLPEKYSIKEYIEGEVLQTEIS